MTVSSLITSKQYTSNGVTTQYAFPNKIFAATDLVVTLIDLTGTQYPFVNFANATTGLSYNVQGVDVDTGCTVAFSGVQTSGWTVDLRTVTADTQSTSIKNQGQFLPELHEEAFDRATRQIQDLLRQTYTFGIHGPDLEVTPWPTLPSAASRKNTSLMFDINGLPTIGVPTTQAITKSLIMQFGPTIYAETYGAAGDGITDSTAGLIAAINALQPGGVLELTQNGVYMVHVNTNHTLLFSGKTNFVIRGNNATIRVFNGDPCGANDEVMMFKNCQDGTVENLILDGNRANRTPVPSTTDHNIDIRDSSARLTFRKVRSINSVGTAWIIQTSTESVQSSYPADVLLEDCTAENAYSNGLAPIATVRLKVRGGRYINTNGTAPQNGIDIEPNSTTTFGNTDLTLEGVDVSGNSGVGLNVGGGGPGSNTHININRLTGSANTNGFITAVNFSDLNIDGGGVMIGSHPNTTRGLIDFGTPGTGPMSDATVRNISFAPQPSLSASQYLIFDQGNVSGRLMIDGVKAFNVTCHGINTNSDATIENIDIKTITQDAVLVTGGVTSLRNITVDNCSLRGLYTNQPTDVNGLTLIDCASTTASAQFDTGSTGAVVRNVLVKQRTAIPGGAVGLFFNVPPASVQNVTCVSAGANYTAANSINFAGGTSGTQTRGLSPNPFSGTATVAPGLLATGAGANGTLTITGAALGDKVTAGPGADSQGMVYSASVSSANTVRWAISNTTGVSLTWASSTWNFSIDKG